MAVDFKITRRFSDGCVEVEAGRKNRASNYYKVPENRVDDFKKEYKKNVTKMGWISAGTLTAAIIAVILPVTHFTKNIGKNSIRTVINLMSGVAAGALSMIATNKIEMKSHSKLLEKYDASVIDYSKSRLKLDA